MLLKICTVIFCLSGTGFALTKSQMNAFQSKVHIEANTGVQGNVTVVADGNKWRIFSNGIPGHDTGTFPAVPGNPNEIEVQSFNFVVKKNPTVAAKAKCLPPGPIAIATNGVVFYNPWSSSEGNAVEEEVFDTCDGHPNRDNIYHYHDMPSRCLFTIKEGVPSPLIGVAFDGFGIYGPVDENGNMLTSALLDECHGRENSDGVYQYHATDDFPYILGCFKGKPLNVRRELLDSDKCHYASEADPDTGAIINN